MTDLVAPTTAGPVTGIERNGMQIFRGIPYAGSTAGEGRFLPAPRPEPWTEPRDCSRFGPLAPQPVGVLENVLGAQPPDCDEATCLTLNVWTPAVDDAAPAGDGVDPRRRVRRSAPAPRRGTTARDFAADGDVVVVTINYRLGALGFLHLADLVGERVRGVGQRRAARPGRGARVGARQHRGVRRRPRRRHRSSASRPAACSVATLLGMPAARGLFRRRSRRAARARGSAPRDAAKRGAATSSASARSSAIVDALRAVAGRRR